MQSLIILCVVCVLLTCSLAAAAAAAAPKASVGISKSKSDNDGRLVLSKGAVNFLSGGMAGTFASGLTLPLEVVKTQMQSSRNRDTIGQVCQKVFATDGTMGFFKGFQPMVIGILPTRAIYFSSYKATKQYLSSKANLHGPINHLLSAFSAGISSNTVMNPWWMIKTRFQILADASVGQKQFSTYPQIIKAIYREEGFGGFMKGVSASYIGCFEGAIQWMAYERLKSQLQTAADEDASNSNSKVSKLGYFTAAAASKALAIVLTYPHEVVRTRLREQASNGVFKYTGFMHTLRIIGKEEGVAGLYGGMGIHLGRSVPNAAVMFLTFELISNYLEDSPEIALPALKMPQLKLMLPSVAAESK